MKNVNSFSLLPTLILYIMLLNYVFEAIVDTFHPVNGTSVIHTA